MNLEEIRQAAFNDELEKIALSVKTLNAAAIRASNKIGKAAPVKKLMVGTKGTGLNQKVTVDQKGSKQLLRDQVSYIINDLGKRKRLAKQIKAS